mgnify:CR=1 FL=1
MRAAHEGELVCLFVLDPYFFSAERARELPHRMQFMLESIVSLQQNLERLGSRLFVVSGKSTEIVPKLAQRWKVDRVFAHRWTEPFGQERDRRVAVDARHDQRVARPERVDRQEPDREVVGPDEPAGQPTIDDLREQGAHRRRA